MIRIALLLAVAICVVAGDGYGYGHGRPRIHNEERVWAHNAKRQLWVNDVADKKVGSGTGTADWHGVPGTALGTGGYGQSYGYGQGGYGGYGYGGHGHAGYGHGGHGYGNYGNGRYGNNGYY